MGIGQPKHLQRECLRGEMHQKRLELWLYKWVQHQDNVPTHSVLLVKGKVFPLQARCGPEGG